MPQFVFVCHIFQTAKKSGDTFQYRQSCFGDKTKLYLLAQRKPKLFKTYLDCRLVRIP